MVARAIGAAAELLGGVGEAVEEEGADQQKIVQHRVGGERHVAGAGALRGEEQERRDQRRGADHDVAVDREHPHQLGAVEQRRARDASIAAASGGARSARRAASPAASAITAAIAAPAMPKSNTSTSSMVAAMLMRLIAIWVAERQSGAGLPDQPAEHDVIAERQRRRPDPDR